MLALCCSRASDVAVAANRVPILQGQGTAPMPTMTCEALMSARSATRSSRGWQLCCNIRTTSMDGVHTHSAARSAQRASGTRGAFAVTWLASITCRRTIRVWSAVASIPTRLTLRHTCGPAMEAVHRRCCTAWQVARCDGQFLSIYLNHCGCLVMTGDVYGAEPASVSELTEKEVLATGECESLWKQCSAVLGWNICWF